MPINHFHLLGITVKLNKQMQPIGQWSICAFGGQCFFVRRGGGVVNVFFHKPSPPSVNKVLIVQASHGMCPHAFEQKLKQNIKSLNNSIKVTFILFL